MSKKLFQELYAVHSRQIFSYFLGRTNDKEIAADLLQDIFLKAWNRIDDVRSIPDDELLYWLFAIASNRLKDYYRKSSYRRNAELGCAAIESLTQKEISRACSPGRSVSVRSKRKSTGFRRSCAACLS